MRISDWSSDVCSSDLGENTHFKIMEQQLGEYFAGKRKTFSVPLFTPGSNFQNLVWKALQQIPFGTTKSYKDQAIAINRPESVRAIANANGMNRISILIPCHRVIGEDGRDRKSKRLNSSH